MSRKWDQLLEDAIIGKLLSTLIDEGFNVDTAMHNGDMWMYCFETERRPTQYNYWIKLVLGNGTEVISDYTTNLEKHIKSVNEFAESLMD